MNKQLTAWTCIPTVLWQSPRPDSVPLCCWRQTWWLKWRPAYGSLLGLRCTRDTWTIRKYRGYKQMFCVQLLHCQMNDPTDLSSSHVLLVHASADMSLRASLATEALMNWDQANSHSASPPAAMALQYTAERRLGWILAARRSITVKYESPLKTAAWSDNIKRKLTSCFEGRPSIVGTMWWSRFGTVLLPYCMPCQWHSPGYTCRGDKHQYMLVCSIINREFYNS